MSRKGKEPIQVPKEVSVIFNDKTRELVTKGKLGDLAYSIPEKVIFDYSEQVIKLTVKDKSCRDSKRLWGLSRALIFNNVKGVSEGFTKVLIINGVGYKAAVDGQFLVLSLGYSHDIYFPVPAGITIVTTKPTEIRISGINKQIVGDIAAQIRNFRKPEPYKGKGIKYETETIIRKAGKRK